MGRVALGEIGTATLTVSGDAGGAGWTSQRPIGLSWSADGTRFASGGYTDPEDHKIYVSDADGSNVTEVGGLIRHTSGIDRTFALSPDGSQLVYSKFNVHGFYTDAGQYQLVVRDVASGAERVLVQDHATMPAVSPDGKTVAYVALTGDTDSTPGEIHKIPFDGGADVKLAGPFNAGVPYGAVHSLDFTPDGQQIAFGAGGMVNSSGITTAAGYLGLVSLGGGVTMLVDTAEGIVGNVGVTPDGGTLAYSWFSKAWSAGTAPVEILTVGLGGGTAHSVAGGTGKWTIAFQPKPSKITGGPDTFITSPDVTLSFLPTSGTECRLVGTSTATDWAACTSPWNTHVSAPGAWAAQVRINGSDSSMLARGFVLLEPGSGIAPPAETSMWVQGVPAGSDAPPSPALLQAAADANARALALLGQLLSDGVPLEVAAAAAGQLDLELYVQPSAGARAASKKGAVLAKAAVTFTRRGVQRIVVKLTSRGKRVARGRKPVRARAVARFRPQGSAKTIAASAAVTSVPRRVLPLAKITVPEREVAKRARIRGKVRFATDWRSGRVELRALPIHGRSSGWSLGKIKPKRGARSTAFAVKLPAAVEGVVRVLACGRVNGARACVSSSSALVVAAAAAGSASRSHARGEDCDDVCQVERQTAILSTQYERVLRSVVEAVSAGTTLPDPRLVTGLRAAQRWLARVQQTGADNVLINEFVATADALPGLAALAVPADYRLCMAEPSFIRARSYGQTLEIASRIELDITPELARQVKECLQFEATLDTTMTETGSVDDGDHQSPVTMTIDTRIKPSLSADGAVRSAEFNGLGVRTVGTRRCPGAAGTSVTATSAAHARDAALVIDDQGLAKVTFLLGLDDSALAFGDCPTTRPPLNAAPGVSSRLRACLDPTRDRDVPEQFVIEVTGLATRAQMQRTIDRTCASGTPPGEAPMNLVLHADVTIRHTPGPIP
jgi:Tol biopolymer transport system component